MERHWATPHLHRTQSVCLMTANFSPSPTKTAPVARLSRELPGEPCLSRALRAAANNALVTAVLRIQKALGCAWSELMPS